MLMNELMKKLMDNSLLHSRLLSECFDEDGKIRYTLGYKNGKVPSVKHDIQKYPQRKTYSLMIKQHWDTGISYLCVTTKTNWVGYKGSGVRWKHLLASQPRSEILTTLLHTTDDRDEFNHICLHFSLLFDVVNNDNFSNLIPEFGYPDDTAFNFVSWWSAATEAQKLDCYSRRADSLRQWHDTDAGKEFRNRQSIRMVERMSSPYIKEKMRSDAIDFFSSPDGIILKDHISFMMQEWYKTEDGLAKIKRMSNFQSERMSDPEYRTHISEKMRTYWENMSDDEKADAGERTRQARLNMSPEAKKLRGERFSMNFKLDDTGEYINKSVGANVNKMKITRIGAGNPNARKVVLFGIEYDCIKTAELHSGLSYSEVLRKVRKMTDDCYYVDGLPTQYMEFVTCPHCNKIGKLSPAFKRWHFENCKLSKGIEL